MDSNFPNLEPSKQTFWYRWKLADKMSGVLSDRFSEQGLLQEHYIEVTS